MLTELFEGQQTTYEYFSLAKISSAMNEISVIGNLAKDCEELFDSSLEQQNFTIDSRVLNDVSTRRLSSKAVLTNQEPRLKL